MEPSAQVAKEAAITEGRAQRRLYRASVGRVFAGVAQGLAEQLRLNPTVVRLAFAVLAAFNGFGVLLYLAFWAAVRLEPVPPPGGRPPTRASDRGKGVALAVVALVVVLLLRSGRIVLTGPFTVPLLLAGAGVAVMWRQADETQRARWLGLPAQVGVGVSRRTRTVAVLRVVGGIALVAAGGVLSLAATTGWRRNAAASAGVVLVGAAILTGPWWWRLVSELRAERRERIRSQERAELAAHLHDSVLQTLALIQRHVEDPREVVRLARGQERELRSWLYRPDAGRQSRFAAALELLAAEVEDAYAIRVEPVVVGDSEVDDRLAAVIQATREALVNAARHASITTVSLYAEVEPERVSVFVRDRGIGFDQAAIPDDRHGLRGSIMDRMHRHGGSATLRTAPGAGTEVELTMSRSQS